jgi:hypothetical protein
VPGFVGKTKVNKILVLLIRDLQRVGEKRLSNEEAFGLARWREERKIAAMKFAGKFSCFTRLRN